jgi:hypothetical protein
MNTKLSKPGFSPTAQEIGWTNVSRAEVERRLGDAVDLNRKEHKEHKDFQNFESLSSLCSLRLYFREFLHDQRWPPSRTSGESGTGAA